jgi:aconitate hydratase
MSQFIKKEFVEDFYQKFEEKLSKIKEKINRPLTLTEKLIYAHFYNEDLDKFEEPKRGESEIELAPDRVVMQDATAQMAVLQFISTGVKKVATPTSIHADHLICADQGGESDLENAKATNKEVYDFLASAAKKYGIDFWQPGSGIIHQIFFENYAFPGSMVIGTDSHTPTAGGMGMFAVGVGGADAVDVMTKQPWLLKMPQIVGVKLTGKLSDWASPKDVILYLLSILSVKGGTGKVLEYFGEGVKTLSATGKSTITNMGAEAGATTSIFPLDQTIKKYLKATNREEIAKILENYENSVKADQEVYENPNDYYDEIIEIDLSEIEPCLNGPHTPDAYIPISQVKEKFEELEIPQKVSAGLIGSCTNSSYEDIKRAAKIGEKALDKGLKLKAELYISPGSNQIRATMDKEGFTEIFEKLGAKILTNSCGPCIGQWNRVFEKEKNTIVTTFNRNFQKRNDGYEETQAFLASPETVMALALSGFADFDPRSETLLNQEEKEVKLEVPTPEDIPQEGFTSADLNYLKPAEDGDQVEILVNDGSDRIQLLEPFQKWDLTQDFKDLRILLKVKGKCTTDHISPAGPWLKYRGHLDNISQNMYLGAENVFASEPGKAVNVETKEEKEVHEVARDYKKEGIGWVVIAQDNYGEGSSREHAAMEPRFLGGTAIIAKSFARIAETNLKKQGLLPLWLKDPTDYDKFKQFDRVDILNLAELKPNSEVKILVKHEDGTEEEIPAKHTLSSEQIEWFFEGSALNKAAKELG